MVKVQINLKKPWSTRSRSWARMWGTCVPVVHVAGALDSEWEIIENLCIKNDIPFAPKPSGAMYRNFLDIEDFPKLLRLFKWSEKEIEEGVQQFRDAIREPYRRHSRKSAAAAVTKRKAEEEEMPAWASELIQRVDDGLNKCFDMVGAQAIPFYFGTKKWQLEKRAAIQARLDAIMPQLEAQVRADLEKRLLAPMEREIRERKTKEFEQNLEREDAHAMVALLRKEKRQKPTEAKEDEEDDDDNFKDEVQDFLKNYFSKNHSD